MFDELRRVQRHVFFCTWALWYSAQRWSSTAFTSASETLAGAGGANCGAGCCRCGGVQTTKPTNTAVPTAANSQGTRLPCTRKRKWAFEPGRRVTLV